MNNSTPKVSVLMSVYNGTLYLKESIESILKQTFTDFEFIILDDCSTDNTWEVLTKYTKLDQRILLIRNEKNFGLTRSLNKGLKVAKGEYIARQDADDISLTERFKKQVVYLNNHSEIVLTSCDIELINAEGASIGSFRRACDPDLLAWYLLFYNRLAGHSQVIFRRKPVIDLGGYSENYRYGQDYELWCRLLKVGKIFILPDILLQQRLHSDRISVEKKSAQEVCALTQVKHNIEQLIEKEISLSEAQDLMGFWIGHWWSHCFPESKQVDILHDRLTEILREFLRQNPRYISSQHEMAHQLHHLIGEQFLSWIRALGIRHELFSKLQVSFYALNWNSPSIVAACWLSDVRKSLARRLTRLKYSATAK